MEEEKADSGVAQEVTTPEVSLLLQHARETKGLSLREAEAATRIPVHYLQLLEGKGDPRILSDAVYLVPFLRTYALFLGLDPHEATAQFIQSVHSRGDTVSHLAEHAVSSPSSVQSITRLVVLVSVVLLALLWLIRRS